MTPSLVWFRQDLRLHDNPALSAAFSRQSPVIPLYILDDTGAGSFKIGQAQRWWLHHSLKSLDTSLKGQLVLRQGEAGSILQEIIQETGAKHVFWNRCYEPWAIARDTRIKEILKDMGVEVVSFNSHLLFEPWTITTLRNEPYKVFTQFWKKCLTMPVKGPPKPVPHLTHERHTIPSEPLNALNLLPHHPNWAHAFLSYWTPGEQGALAQMDAFLTHKIEGYQQNRNRPDLEGTSRLSPYLHWGELSVRLLWQRLQSTELLQDQQHFLSELGWREFSYHLLYHFPHLPTHSFKPGFDHFPWADDPWRLSRWQKGITGYPIIDAGMRELWQTGWMHNRVRMIVASFLVKDLLIDWRLGQEWFHDTLLDADVANNAASWQWVAGSGADAAPYFRIFNPILQGEKFDPQGNYVKKWLPELKKLPPAWIHKPWQAPDFLLQQAGISLGKTYPLPLVDHKQARETALRHFKELPLIP